jgi:sigma-B regulation protein RsbU (phosphoserine phosphatase)
LSPEAWRFLEHAFWVVFEDFFLVITCIAGVREMKAIATQQAKIELTEQLEREMEIAAQIQTAIVPRDPVVEGLQISATMIPATEVGGDYYDVVPVADGCWIGICDVAGHGLIAGLVMLQAQSAIKALLLSRPDRAPRDVVSDVNRLLYDNVRKRLGHDEHMTMSLIRYYNDGRLIVAGAHQQIIVLRAGTGTCERLPVEGTWLGLVDDILPVTRDRAHKVGVGDTIILFTDGITEATKDHSTEQFGLDRLCAEVERMHSKPVAEIRDALIESVRRWSAKERQEDDVTILVFRHVGSARTTAAA